MKYFAVMDGKYMIKFDAADDLSANNQMREEFPTYYFNDRCTIFRYTQIKSLLHKFPDVETSSHYDVKMRDAEAEVKYHLSRAEYHNKKATEITHMIHETY